MTVRIRAHLDNTLKMHIDLDRVQTPEAKALFSYLFFEEALLSQMLDMQLIIFQTQKQKGFAKFKSNHMRTPHQLLYIGDSDKNRFYAL